MSVKSERDTPVCICEGVAVMLLECKVVCQRGCLSSLLAHCDR